MTKEEEEKQLYRSALGGKDVAGVFCGSGAVRGSFTAAVGFRALAFSFTARCAACAKYPARWDAIWQALGKLYRATHLLERGNSARACAKTAVFTARAPYRVAVGDVLKAENTA